MLLSNVGCVVRSVINRIVFCRAKCGRRSQLQHPAVSFRRRLVTRVSLLDNTTGTPAVEVEEGGGVGGWNRRAALFFPFHPIAETESPCAFG